MTADAVIRLEHFAQLRGFAWRWPHFTPAELADDQTDELVVAPAALDWLEELRAANGGVPLIINDATRSAARQRLKSGRAMGSHVDGMAFDIRCAGEFAEKLERVAIRLGVLGRGVYQGHDRPMSKRFLHVDMWTLAPPGLRPRLWSG